MIDAPQPHYRGRFAPSPTGHLHAGSLMTAVGSYLEAKSHQGEWLLRIEDLDPPREIAGAAQSILHTLEAFGFEWDREIAWQSLRHEHYTQALEQLVSTQRAYPCSCTRKELSLYGQRGVDGFIYHGQCRNGLQKTRETYAWRFRLDDGAPPICLHDAVQGHYTQDLNQSIGDFVLKRADGLWAYQLAVVVDDAAQGITHIVRGADLLISTPRQIALQQALHYPTPHYTHLPILVNAAGEKLSKQTLAPAIDATNATQALRTALTRLNHTPPRECETLPELWQWALQNWKMPRVQPTPVRLSS